MRKPRGWRWIVPYARPGRGRGWRFIMRSISQSVVAHDSSYNDCFILKGDTVAVGNLLSRVAPNQKALRMHAFEAGVRACAIHILRKKGTKNKYRTVCPALAYHTRAPSDADGAEVHVWVHPAAGDEAFKVLELTRVREKIDVKVAKCDDFARVELVGEKSFELIQKLAKSLDFYADRHISRGIRRFVAADPRAAAWNVETDAKILEAPTDTAPTQAEYAVSRTVSRMASFERPWEEATAVDVKAYSAMIINRGSVAIEGYTIIVPKSWNLPLWLGVCQAGARSVGLVEWLWCAQRFGRAVFPDDYLDTAAGAEKRRELFDDISAIKSKKPLGKVSSVLRSTEERDKDVHVHNVLRVPDTKLELGTLPHDVMVRVTLRCPWSGQPTLGSEIHIPTTAQRDAWCSKKSATKTRRRDDVLIGIASGESIGYVTSVSAPAASVGLASALIKANSVKSLLKNFSRGKAKVFVMITPPGKPAVPAEALIVVKASHFDDPWF